MGEWRPGDLKQQMSNAHSKPDIRASNPGRRTRQQKMPAFLSEPPDGPTTGVQTSLCHSLALRVTELTLARLTLMQMIARGRQTCFKYGLTGGKRAYGPVRWGPPEPALAFPVLVSCFLEGFLYQLLAHQCLPQGQFQSHRTVHWEGLSGETPPGHQLTLNIILSLLR